MYHFLLPSNTINTTVTTASSPTTVYIEVLPDQLLIIGDEAVNTAYLTQAERRVSITAAGTYHLRFSLNGSNINSFTPPGSKTFYLVDVSDVNYNPGSLSSTDPFWFKFVDDVLLAEIDASSFPTVVENKFNYSLQLSVERAVEARTRFRNSDIEFLDPNTGVILQDRITGDRYRLYISSGTLNLQLL